MADGKITIKSSLALRAFIVSLALLVVPLFLHSLFLYWSEYQGALDEAKENLNIVAKGQRVILEQQSNSAWQILDAAAESPEWKARFSAKAISVSSQNPERFVKIDTEKMALMVGEKTTATDALVLYYPIEPFFSGLDRLEKASYPLFSAFIDKNGRVLAGSKKSLVSDPQTVEGADFFLLISTEQEAIQRLHKEWYVWHFLQLLFWVGVVGGLLAWALTRRVSKPLTALCRTMERVGEGALHVRYPSDWMGFEINQLGKQFNQMLDQVVFHQQLAQEERSARERLAQELKIGREIQSGLLPKHVPEYKGLDIACRFFPALEVAGDFYDLLPIGEHRLLIVIADTSGKGVSACLYSLGLRSILRALALEDLALSDLVLRANDLFWQDAMHSGMFVTLWIGIYDSKTRELEYCSQGHPPAYLIRKNQRDLLWTAGIALGAQCLDVISTKKQILEQGDLLFLYTDGILDSQNPSLERFGKFQLEASLETLKQGSSDQIVEGVISDIGLFCQGAPQHDDIAMMAIRLKANSRFS